MTVAKSPGKPLFSALTGLASLAILLQGLWAGIFLEHDGRRDEAGGWIDVHARGGEVALMLAVCRRPWRSWRCRCGCRYGHTRGAGRGPTPLGVATAKTDADRSLKKTASGTGTVPDCSVPRCPPPRKLVAGCGTGGVRMRGSDRNGPWAAGLLLIAGCAYSLWLLEFFLPTGLDPVRSFVSEHYPVFQPYQRLFRAADVVAGTAYVLAADLLRRVLPPARAAAALCWSLVVFGAGTVIDAVFVPDCVSTVDPVCERLEFTGQVSWPHLVHLGSSVVTEFAVVVVAFATVRLAGRYGSRADRKLVRVLFTSWVVAGFACVAAYPFGWPGLPQRIQLLVVSAATAAGAARCLHGHHTPPRMGGEAARAAGIM
jgi:Protein of unknown function (DUF998)